MTLHAPGPWQAEGFESLVVNAADGSTICACPGTTDGSLSQAKANAALMAAAPDLLAALKTIMTTPTEYAATRAYRDRVAAARTAALAAIAKAEGRAHG